MNKATSFLTKLAEDKGLQASLIAASQTAVTVEEKVAATTKIANEAGFAVSADELQKMVESFQTPSGKLSDDDLENVSGGVDVSTGIMIGAMVGGQIINAGVVGASDAIHGAVNDATGAVTGAVTTAAEDTGRAVAGAVSDAGNAIASVFSGW